MSNEEERSKGAAAIGRWIAIGSELPCLVIALLFGGQIVGRTIWGPDGSTWGALIGALAGFVFGVISIYITIRFYEQADLRRGREPSYMPSKDEIFEDVRFDSEDEEDS